MILPVGAFVSMDRDVSLAMTPNYTLRRSRYNPCFCMAFQPMPVFIKLLSTPEKLKTALDKVRTLTDAFDDVEYSPDVRDVGNGTGCMSKMFFINDTNDSSPCPFSRLRSEKDGERF